MHTVFKNKGMKVKKVLKQDLITGDMAASPTCRGNLFQNIGATSANVQFPLGFNLDLVKTRRGRTADFRDSNGMGDYKKSEVGWSRPM